MKSSVWIHRVAGGSMIFAAAVGLASNASCVLVDGPPDLPVPPTRRPTILNVTPSAGLLGELPAGGEFDVTIELPDPTQSVTWIAFLDFDAQSPSSSAFANGTAGGSSTAADVTTVTFNLSSERIQGNACHTVHFLVALTSAFDNQVHDTDPNLSDTIDWFIVPGGNPGGCTTYDGGGFFEFPDASDASPE